MATHIVKLVERHHDAAVPHVNEALDMITQRKAQDRCVGLRRHQACLHRDRLLQVERLDAVSIARPAPFDRGEVAGVRSALGRAAHGVSRQAGCRVRPLC